MRRYALVYVKVSESGEFKRYTFVGIKTTKDDVIKKGLAPEYIVKKEAVQLKRGECKEIEIQQGICSVDVVFGKHKVRSHVYEGRHKVCVYPDRVTIK